MKSKLSVLVCAHLLLLGCSGEEGGGEADSGGTRNRSPDGGAQVDGARSSSDSASPSAGGEANTRPQGQGGSGAHSNSGSGSSPNTAGGSGPNGNHGMGASAGDSSGLGGAPAAGGSGSGGSVATGGGGNGQTPCSVALPISTPISIGSYGPDHQVTDVDGNSVNLCSLSQGKPMVLIFSEINCSGCRALAKRLADEDLSKLTVYNKDFLGKIFNREIVVVEFLVYGNSGAATAAELQAWDQTYQSDIIHHVRDTALYGKLPPNSTVQGSNSFPQLSTLDGDYKWYKRSPDGIATGQIFAIFNAYWKSPNSQTPDVNTLHLLFP